MGNHKKECRCVFCRNERGETHKEGCNCGCCRVSEGESIFGGQHHTEESKKKIREASRNMSLSTRKKIGEASRGRHQTEEAKKKIGEKNKRKTRSPELRQRLREANKNPSADLRKRNSEAHKKLWKDSEYVKKQMASRLVSQNKAEKTLQGILDRNFPGQWRFVGDGRVIINGKCPDFINEKKKFIIELFGDYWHKLEEVEPRIKFFENYGYKTLIIWEHELKDLESNTQKILHPLYAEGGA